MPPRSAAARALSPWQATADLCLRRGHSDTQRHVWSVSRVSAPFHGSWCAPGFICALWVSLAGMRFDSKGSFAPPPLLLGLLLCPWMWGIVFLVSNIPWSVVVQQLVSGLVFSRKEVGARPSSLPSCCCCWGASVVSDSVWPHGRQPTRPLCPWDSPGKNTGVGCHCLRPW